MDLVASKAVLDAPHLKSDASKTVLDAPHLKWGEPFFAENPPFTSKSAVFGKNLTKKTTKGTNTKKGQ
jgi:hypothetical protein